MKNREAKRKWPIRQRMFIQLLTLMLVVFTSIFLSFNLFFENYIRSSVYLQLETGAESVNKLDFSKDPQQIELEELEREPDLTSFIKNSIHTEAKLFNINDEYEITDYDKNEDYSEIEKIAEYLEKNKISLSDAKYNHIKTGAKEYYVSTIRDPILNDTNMVFYVDVSDIKNLMKTINLVLGMILSIAMIICLFMANAIANTITKPVKKLSAFAGELGHGNFIQLEERFRDIEFNELKDVMNQSARQLDENDREQNTFFQNVSHELRTPLMSIRCYAEGVAYGVMDSEKSGQIIIAETDRLSALVEDLLYFSQLENLSKTAEKKETDLRETISICAVNIQALSEKKGISLVFDFDDEPVWYSCNENHIYRAINNLLSNAVRYAEQRIVIGCHRTSSGIEISVEDDGTGISDDDLPHIFDRFYKGKGGKTGIGLSIVSSIAEMYEGKITVTGVPKNRFILQLPVTVKESK